MATVNIPSYLDDPNYRYKMPKVRAKIEGRGNGIRTNIMNMGDIARALKRPPEYPTKFCGCELGSQSKFETAEGKAIVNGAHSDQDLQMIIDKFVDRFVLCPNCRLPEIDLQVSKGRVKGKCNACGFSGDMDNTHKVGTYIIRNPPDGGDSTMGKKSKKSKEERRAEKAAAAAAAKNKGSSTDAEDNNGGAEDSAEEVTSETEKKEKKHHKKDKHHHHKSSSSAEKKDKKKDKEDKEDKKDKKKKEKKKSRKVSDQDDIQTAGGAGPDADNDDSAKKVDKEVLDFDSEEIAMVAQRLTVFVQDKPLPQALFQEVRLLQVSQDFNSTLRVYVVLLALFGDSITADRLKQSMPYMQVICDRSVSGNEICSALEEYIERHAQSSWAQFPLLCSTLYQADLIEEETFLTRYLAQDLDPQSVTAKAKTHALTFLQWLEAAESASESDGSDD